MKLVSFSVENFRSITTARKIPLSSYSLLVGANNEGKSNILHALAIGMDALITWNYYRRTSDGRHVRLGVPLSLLSRAQIEYNWNTDFPISKQAKANENSKTNITLEFSLDTEEINAFKEEIKSNLNGTLPIIISFGPRGFDLSVQKPGKGYVSLNKKSARIAEFVSTRIRFEYIPAIRTSDIATRVIAKLVEKELKKLDDNLEYSQALAKIEQIQQPILMEVASTIQATVSNFLPNVRAVRLESRRDARNRAIRREVEILVDDGQQTKLERKGDGVQSLVVLALMRHTAEQSHSGSNTVIAIEEPESHLHPNAVHELRAVIEDLSKNNQIVLSSHSPLFVNMNDISNTIIVKESQAKCARRISEIREALGVRFSDNLYNASVVLICEGPDDIKALKAILTSRSKKIKSALESGFITFDYLGGASGLLQKVSFYRSSACGIQCFIDNDSEGKSAVDRAVGSKALKISDVNLCSVPSMDESEIEDIYDRNIYRQAFIQEYGVDPKARPLANGTFKWSNRMERLFREAGKPWTDEIKAQVKGWLAEFAAQNPDVIVKTELAGPLISFIDSIEVKIPK